MMREKTLVLAMFFSCTLQPAHSAASSGRWIPTAAKIGVRSIWERPAFPLRLRGGDRQPPSLERNVTDTDVVRVLAHMLTPDSNQIRAAEEEMDHMVRQQAAGCCRGLLACMLRNGTAIELRQLAAVLLRRRIGEMWEMLSEQQQCDVQQRLGDALVDDLAASSAKLRRLLALCIAAVTSLSSTVLQLDALVERVLAAAASKEGPPTVAVAAISILEMLMESMASDMHRHLAKIHDVAIAGLDHTQGEVRMSSVKLGSSLLVQTLGRTDPGFTAELVQRLHALLSRAVNERDAVSVHCILLSLAEVVPYAWGNEACDRTQDMLSLALNVTVEASMPLVVCESAALFVVELVQCQTHVIIDQRLFASITRSLTAHACASLVHQVASTRDLHHLLRIARAADTHQAHPPFGSHVMEKRQDVLVGDDNEMSVERQSEAHGSAECEEDIQARCDITLRALRMVLSSDGCISAVTAFKHHVDVLCLGATNEQLGAKLLLVRMCSEASAACEEKPLISLNLVSLPPPLPSSSNVSDAPGCTSATCSGMPLSGVGCWVGLTCMSWQTNWALSTLVEGMVHSDGGIRRLALHSASGIVAALQLDWSQQNEQTLVQVLLKLAREAAAKPLLELSGSEDDTAAVVRALAVLMSRLDLQPAIHALLPDLVTVFAELLSSAAQQTGVPAHVQKAALESLSAVARVAKGQMPDRLLSTCFEAIDPFLLGQSGPDCGSEAQEDSLVTEREVWVASIECLGALAMAGTWNTAAMQQHAVSMVERLLLALTDADADDSSVREAALAALPHLAHALGDTFYPFLPVVRLTCRTFRDFFSFAVAA